MAGFASSEGAAPIPESPSLSNKETSVSRSCHLRRARCAGEDFFIPPPQPCWYFRAEGAAIQRVPSTGVTFATLDIPLLSGEIGGPTQIAITTESFNYDFSPAGQFLIGHTLSECIQIEGVYTGVKTASNSQAARDDTPNPMGANGCLFSPFSNFGESVPISGVDYNNYAAITYTNSLQGAELNVRRQLPQPPWLGMMSVILGVRYIGMPEDLSYFTQSDVTSAGTIVTDGATNDIHVSTTNEMVGPQVGALLQFYLNQKWWADIGVKAAVMNNCCGEKSTYINIDDGITRVYESSQSGSHTSFAGELDLMCCYKWTPRFMTRVGYRALWLTGMALAQDNFNTNINFFTNDNTQLRQDAGIVYHGPYIGAELSW
jgi:hypothetical protein